MRELGEGAIYSSKAKKWKNSPINNFLFARNHQVGDGFLNLILNSLRNIDFSLLAGNFYCMIHVL